MDKIVITQADREFANELWRCSADECDVAQFIARHRIDSQRPLIEALEKALPWIGKIPFRKESVVKVDDAIADTLAAIKQAKGE